MEDKKHIDHQRKIGFTIGMDWNIFTKSAYQAGADIVVIGNAIEKSPSLLVEVADYVSDINKGKEKIKY